MLAKAILLTYIPSSLFIFNLRQDLEKLLQLAFDLTLELWDLPASVSRAAGIIGLWYQALLRVLEPLHLMSHCMW